MERDEIRRKTLFEEKPLSKCLPLTKYSIVSIFRALRSEPVQVASALASQIPRALSQITQRVIE